MMAAIWEKHEDGSVTALIWEFDTEEEARKWGAENQRGRNFVVATTPRERSLLWNMVGARCPIELI